MSEYWFKNPMILLQDINEFFPKKEFNKIQKVNAIVRLSIYYSILIIILKLDTKYLAVSISLMLLSYFLGATDQFEITVNKENNNESCVHPTKENPFMNFTVGDHINNPNRKPACKIDDDNIREEEILYYRDNRLPDPSDLYGKTITDRNFYTMPSTTIVNDQNAFANFAFGDFGRCKSENKDCLKNRDNRFHRGRYYYQY
jgi:hypothetical protein